jgi:hypothetical protein
MPAVSIATSPLPRTVEDQQREAQRQRHRIATLLDRNNDDAGRHMPCIAVCAWAPH